MAPKPPAAVPPAVQAPAPVLADVEQVTSDPATSPDAVAVARPMPKLSRTMMRSWVARHLSTVQGNLCPMCGKYIDLKIKGEGVIDHDHDSGEIRGVLHRSCNAAEGKISNAAARWGAKSDSYTAIIAFLEATVRYLKQPGAGVIYPMHKSKEEKLDAGKLRQKKLRAERKAKQAVAIAARSNKGT